MPKDHTEIRPEDRKSDRVERKRARTRREILKAAEEILVAEGVEAVTLASVSRKLALTKQALYHYFPSKEALVRTLTTSLLNDEIESIIAALDKAPPKANLLDVMVRAFYKHYRHNLDAFRTIYCQTQLKSAQVLRLDEETIREQVNPRTRHLFDVLEERLSTPDMNRKERARIRRLAFSAWLSALGLITMLGVAESTSDPLIHTDKDLLDTLANVYKNTTGS